MSNYSSMPENISLKNASVVCALVMITVCVVGWFLNFLCVLIFTRPSFRVLSINRLLSALSLSNICLLLLAIPSLALGPLRSFSNVVNIAHAVGAAYVYPFLTMFHCFSIWILIFITAERWFAICRPLTASIYCTKKRAFRLMVAVATAAILFNVVRFWDFSLDEDYQPVIKLRAKRWYQFWYATVAQMTFIYILPLSIISHFTVLMMIGLKKSSQSRLRMTGPPRRHQRANQRTAKMLLFVIFSFIVSYSLSLMLCILQQYQIEMFSMQVGLLLGDLDNLLVISNAASPFFFYFKYSRRFSRALRALFAFVCSCGRLPMTREYSTSIPNTLSQHAEKQMSVVAASVLSASFDRRSSCAMPLSPPSTSRSEVALSSLATKETICEKRSLYLEVEQAAF